MCTCLKSADIMGNFQHAAISLLVSILVSIYVRRHSGTGIEKAKAKQTEYLLQIPVRSTLPSSVIRNQGLLEIEICSYDSFKLSHFRPCSTQF